MNPEKNYHRFPKNKKNSTTVTTLTINQHIRMISEKSCDTEDWSYDDEGEENGRKSPGDAEIEPNKDEKKEVI